jgi:glycosyltransferase involved in cell wall biosynthesis
VLILHTHPVQYLAPLFRRYADDAGIELTVAYCDVPAAQDGLFDPGYGVHTQWGLDLLAGYRYVRLTPWGSESRHVNPGVVALIFREDFDLVIAYGYNFVTSWLSLLAAKFRRTRWVFVSDNFTVESQRGRSRPWKRAFLTSLAKIADGVIAQSVRSAEFYRQFFKTVELVPHAIDDERFVQDANSKPSLPHRAAHETVFLYVGKLIPRKRVVDAIAAVSAVPDASLWIVGLGPDESYLRDEAEANNAHVAFLGFRDQTELPAVYAAADVVVLPSSIETFGLVVSEAASVGRPSIVSNACGAVGSIVLHGVTGEVVRVADREELARSMTRLCDANYRERLRTNLEGLFQGWTAAANVNAFRVAVHRLSQVPE